MHIDLNSCFATVTQQAFPHLRGKPLVMAAYNSPRGCILAPSIEAKKLGIKTGMRVMEARLICKDIIVRTTDTALVRDVHLRLKKICKDYSISVSPKSIDEVVMDFGPMEYTLKRSLVDIATEIKERLKAEIGEWISASVGIGTNRFLAKTGASLHKPNGLDVITHENIKEIYSQMSLTDLCGINTRFEARLNTYGIFTPLQFLDAPPTLLTHQVFKSICGYYWYKRLRGWEVDDVDFERKSFGQDYALSKHTKDSAELSKIMMKLCEKMGRRLRKSGHAARGIHVAVVYADYTSWHRGRLTQSSEMYSTIDLYRGAQLIFNEQPEQKIISKISVSCYGLAPSSKSQLSLFEQDSSKSRKVSDALDEINNRYGEFIITPALMLGMDSTIVDRISFGGVRELEEMYEI